MMETPDDPDAPELRQRVTRYRDAGPLRRAAMRLTGDAPTPQQREQARRRELGVEGRLAEDVVRLVQECDAIWTMLAEQDLPEDLTLREFSTISQYVLGRPVRPRGPRPLVDVSLAFDDPRNVLTLRRIIPSATPMPQITAYRYATLRSVTYGAIEPFIVGLRSKPTGERDVVATMLVAATFLRHERQFGIFSTDDLEQLEVTVRLDLLETIRTRQLLGEA